MKFSPHGTLIDSSLDFNAIGSTSRIGYYGTLMIFGNWPIEETEGAILGYAVMAGAHSLRKGTIITRDHFKILKQAGITHIFAALLERDDTGEDEAACLVGKLLISENIESSAPVTGRINLFARCDGFFHADVDAVNAINLHDTRISVATLRNNFRVKAGQMVATIKIIPFAVPAQLIENLRTSAAAKNVLDVKPFKTMTVGLIQSQLPSTRTSVLDKTSELMSKRIKLNKGSVRVEHRVTHEVNALVKCINELQSECDLILIFSASSIADEADIVPRAIVAAGGKILRIGMPVDPGNLLVLSKIGEKYIIVAPGSARSARENSLDWILDRLMAGINLTADDMAKMGVGGLLL